MKTRDEKNFLYSLNLQGPLPNFHEIDISATQKAWDDYQNTHDFSLQTTLSPFHSLPTLAEVLAFFTDAAFQTEGIQKLLRSVHFHTNYFSKTLRQSILFNNSVIQVILNII